MVDRRIILPSNDLSHVNNTASNFTITLAKEISLQNYTHSIGLGEYIPAPLGVEKTLHGRDFTFKLLIPTRCGSSESLNMIFNTKNRGHKDYVYFENPTPQEELVLKHYRAFGIPKEWEDLPVQSWFTSGRPYIISKIINPAPRGFLQIRGDKQKMHERYCCHILGIHTETGVVKDYSTPFFKATGDGIPLNPEDTVDFTLFVVFFIRECLTTKVTRKVKIYVSMTKKNYGLLLPRYKQMVDANRYHYIYCNIVQQTQIGSQYGQILRVVDTKVRSSTNFNPVYYQDCSRTTLQEVSIKIVNQRGREIIFDPLSSSTIILELRDMV